MKHALTPDVSFDGGDLDCGNGLLLLIRKHIDPLPRGGLLEIRSTEISVDDDLPAWCRMTRNALVSWTRKASSAASWCARAELSERATGAPAQPRAVKSAPAHALPRVRRVPLDAPPIPSLAVTGMGSWPRPRWLVEAMHAHVQGRLDEAAFQETADDAVRLIAAAQQRAGATMYTDGEQRRDSYASFVATRLDNCQLVPLTDLLPLVEDPASFEAELRALDVPASEVRHPGVFGRIRRSRPIAVHEFEFLRTLTVAPIKVALPGPYLLTRTMWMECIADSVYATRDEIAADIVRVLREEMMDLLDAGVALVQLDEPVLSEVVFSGPKTKRSFMCGALSESEGPDHELGFARELVNAVIDGLPRERTALHVCRGNWTPDESVALAGELCAADPDAGRVCGWAPTCWRRAHHAQATWRSCKQLPADARIGVGVVNQKNKAIETVDEIAERIERAVSLFGAERLLLHPDCGFATFADNPICSMQVAEGKLAAVAQAAQRFAARCR